MSPNQYVSDLRAERDALRAKVARVEALAERFSWDTMRQPDWTGREVAEFIRAALGSTESDPAATTRQATAQGAGDGV